MLDLSTKGALTLFLCVCAFVVPVYAQLVLLAVVILLPFLHNAFAFNSLRARKAYRRFLAYAAALGVLLVVLNGLLIRDGTTVGNVFGIHLFESGILFGLRVATRLLLLSFSLLVFFLSTKVRTIAVALLNSGFPTQVVLPVLLALHFLDQLPVRIERIFAAQEARGAPVRGHPLKRARALFSILTPLLLSSIAESVERGVVLELRGLGESSNLSVFERPVASPQRRPIAFLFLALTILLLMWKIAQWVS